MSRSDILALADMFRLLGPVSDASTLLRFRDALVEYIRDTCPKGWFNEVEWVGYITYRGDPRPLVRQALRSAVSPASTLTLEQSAAIYTTVRRYTRPPAPLG